MGKRSLGTASVLLSALLLVSVAHATTSFSFQVRMGYAAGDDWEPAVSSDGAGHVYLLTTHYGGVPGCAACGNPSIMIQVSKDSGSTFSSPAPLFGFSGGEWDPQVKVDAQKPGYVFVSYMEGGKQIAVQRSIDYGVSWSNPVKVNLGIKQGWIDKDGLAVSGSNVYVAFDTGQQFYVGTSHDYGLTFSVAQMPAAGLPSGEVLNGGGAVGPDGSVYMAWELVTQSGNAAGPQYQIVTYSHDFGSSWSLAVLASGIPPPMPCTSTGGGNGNSKVCGWDFFGTGSAVATDGGGAVYVLYNAPTQRSGPSSIYLSKSTNGGLTWSAPKLMNKDGTQALHAFPAIAAGPAGVVYAGWMDNHTSGKWNVWFVSSSDGGSTWSGETQISQFVSGFNYISSSGFAFPYGDYWVMDFDPSGHLNLAWGEGPNYSGPGNCFYSHS